jgi:myosin protein heavy chain
VDQETKSRATPSSRRRDSRIEELTNQLHQTKDKGDSLKSSLQRSPGKSQHPEADRQKTKYEAQIETMRKSIDAMVC